MKGTCKLCLTKKDLIGRSHLFPNFMFKGIPDEKNRMNLISSAEPLAKRKVQSGAYEEYILCADCDNNNLSKLERYANNYLYSKPYRTNTANFEQVENGHGINSIRCKNIDYKGFKLFLESLIWRASISSHDFFKNFKLLADQEEQLRTSLLNLTPLAEDDFACIMLTHQDEEGVETDLIFLNITRPRKVSFFINQFTYLFHLDKGDVDNAVREITLTQKNEMSIVKLPTGAWASLRASVFHGVAEITKCNLVNADTAK
jgi:hypothetical protein